MRSGAPKAGFLARRRTFGILTTLQKNFFRSNYHAELLSGVFWRAAEAGHDLKVMAFDPEKHSSIPEILHEHSLDGLMALTWRWIHPKFARLVENAREERVLVVNDPLPGLGVNIVHTDVEAGMKLAVAHLCKKGVREIGMLHGPMGVSFRAEGKSVKLPFIDTRLKKEGFTAALKSKKIPVKRAWIRAARANSEPEGYRVMKRWIREKDLPKAVVCGNDDLAFGAIKAVTEAGMSCPRDIAVIGFDDNDRAKHFTPPLTTVRQPLVQMGKDAVDILLGQITRPTASHVSRKYSPKLIIRKTA